MEAYTAVIYDSVLKDADDCVKDFFYRQASGSINKYSFWLMLFMAFAFSSFIYKKKIII